MITDCHVHIQPFELLLSPPALELMRKHQPDFDRVLEFTRSPRAFLKYMDEAGLDRAVLINAAAPGVTGYPAGLNALAAQYVKEDPERLISCGSLHPRHSSNVMADIEEIVRLGLRLIKIHPPHQLQGGRTQQQLERLNMDVAVSDHEARTHLMNGFGKGTASAVPLTANKNEGFSP